MKLFWVFAISLIGPFAGCGCQEPAAPVAASVEQHKSPSQAQPKLATVKLWVGAEELIAEQAVSPKEIETGMMFRKTMAENEAMIFVFARPHRASFWMRNTVLPLSCAYIDGEGVIRDIRDMTPFDESPIEASTDQVQYVLEVNQGWFKRHNITTGMVVRTEAGTLKKTFFRVE
jgi:uncharacterized protein